MSTFEVRIASGADDVEERAPGSVNFTSSDLELADDNPSQPGQTIGLRFTAIAIPQGAVITNAYIQFQVDEVSTGAATLQIHGEDTDNAAAFADIAFNVSSRQPTTATVAWSPSDWTTVGQAGADQQTADISSIIQEILNRPGWTANNSIAFVITGSGTRTAEAFNGVASAAPLLHVEYLPPGPVSDPVVFSIPADANLAADQIAENSAAGTAVGITASAADPDASDTVTYSVDDPRFAINANSGVITRSGTGTLDFETEPSITLTVTATSSDGSADTQAFTLGVLDVNEQVAFNTPADADPAANRIVENAAAGTAVGITASATDPDGGDTLTYSVDDPRFAIDANGVITRSGAGMLDFQTEPTIPLTVTADSSDGSTATQAFTLSVVEEAPQALFRFAVFGDFGDSNPAGEQAVAALVESWNVDFILTVGDNAYAPVTIDNAVGQNYADYIGNYSGSYGSGSTISRFFPTLGNHDYDDAGVGAYLAYFTLPDNERYYDFQVGSVHYFAINSDSNEPDGITMGSTQAQWLQTALAASEATYNVVYFHHTPYLSNGGGDADMRWPFEAWGADAVFAGHTHDFDLVLRDDNGDTVQIPYVTTGRGGAGTEPPDAGANLVTITTSGMLIEYYTVDGVLWDSYFVDAPADVDPLLFVNGNDIMNGSVGADYLWGLYGNDTLSGFAGDDMQIGGDGDDLFVFGVGDGRDTVADFQPGAGTADRLDLRAFGIDTVNEFLQVGANQGPDVVIDLGGGDQITLRGVQIAQFHNDDFLL